MIGTRGIKYCGTHLHHKPLSDANGASACLATSLIQPNREGGTAHLRRKKTRIKSTTFLSSAQVLEKENDNEYATAF